MKNFILKVLTGSLFLSCSTMLFAASSTYQKTCKNTKLITTEYNGVDLVSTCQRINQSWIPAKVSVKHLHNIDGKLEYGREDFSTFQRTCNSIRLNETNQKVTVSALCKDKKGAMKTTSIELKNLHNMDGKLTYKE